MSFGPGTLADGDIPSIIDAIANAHGGTFIQPPIRSGTRQFLYALLNAYGVTDESVHRLVSDKDLAALYATARGSSKAGAKVASRIASQYGNNPLLDPVNFKPVAEATVPWGRTPTPTPTGEYATLVGAIDDITGRVDRLATSIVRVSEDAQRYTKEHTSREVETLRGNLTDTLRAVTDKLPDVINQHVIDALKALTPVTLTVVMPNAEPVLLGMVHRETSKVINMLAAGVNVYLHGPAGSGKTTVGRKCAEAFGLPFYFAAKVESEYMLLGFKDARGETVRTQFREAYEHGGVFLFDELDGSSPSAVVALNAALANGICPFPDGIIMRHADFKCIGAGNTKLSGASRQYVGRAQLDAASVDRFAFVEFGYDDALETALATNSAWVEYVQAARKAVLERGLPHLVTPRATYDGCKLLEAGLGWQETADAVIWKGLDADTVDQIRSAMPRQAGDIL